MQSRRLSREPLNSPLTLERPGQARCHCGALLCKVLQPSCVDIKCKRCARLVRLTLTNAAIRE